MNGHNLTTLAVALAVLLAVGVSATTLSAAVTSDPSQAVDVNYDLLPIDDEDVAEIHREIRANEDSQGDDGTALSDGRDTVAAHGRTDRSGESDGGRGTTAADDERRDSRESVGERSADRDATDERGEGPLRRDPAGERTVRSFDEPDDPDSDSDEADDDEAADGDADDAAGDDVRPDEDGDLQRSDGNDEEGGGVIDDVGRGDSLVAVGERGDAGPRGIVPGPDSLLVTLAWLLGLAALLVAALKLVRWVRARRQGRSIADESTVAGVERTLPSGPPADENEIYAAWDALVRRLDLDDARNLTTGECAAAARSAGMDDDAVSTLRRTFEEIRYGDRPVRDEHRQHVSEIRQRLGLDTGGGGT